jgi:cytochrome c peroxidase
MRLAIIITGIATGALFLSALALTVNPSLGAKPAIADVRRKVVVFSKSCDNLQQTINRLDSRDPLSVQSAKTALLNCRYQYKEIEFFLEYFFISSARIFNGASKFDPGESETGYQEPVGFQEIEALLFAPDVGAQKGKLMAQAAVVCSSARDLSTLFDEFQTSDRQLLRSLQQELVRIMALGITGYDASLLKSGITESYYALRSIQTVLAPLLKKSPSTETSGLLSTGMAYLKAHQNFDGFDRMYFLTRYAMPLQHQLNIFIRQSKLELNTGSVLNYRAKNLFSRDAFYKGAFLDVKANNKELVVLGRQLFFEKGLSGPGTRSCATCHQPERYFTDGLPQSLAIDGHSHVLRNAPSLLYAGFQYSQFWDARAKSLVEQVKDVLASKEEMAADETIIVARLAQDKRYNKLFKNAFQRLRDHSVSLDGIATCIAAYELSLSPQNSAFDRYMAGNKLALTKGQIQGFNLFMGKARCATCHFAPLFNGLVPPLYKTTELEILGVPQTDDRKNVVADQDDGRYRLFPIRLNKGAFKTPTIRNVAKTGPYMHNGSFHTLEKVLDFYNGGGGNGWGLTNNEQTLSSDSLKLNKSEIKAIISFLNGVTDQCGEHY